MKRLQAFRIPYQKDPDLKTLIASHLGISSDNIIDLRILKRSLDARNRSRFFWEYTLDVYLKGDTIQAAFEPFPQINWTGPAPLILGAGPAGLFAAWTFLEHGIKPILFERGERTRERMRKISRYWRYGELDSNSNVCNGEGGAGTFSDGKLITRIKSPLIERVMQAFVSYGAPAEIAYAYNPHVGSNLIREVIRRMSDDLITRGADLRFLTQVESLKLSKRHVEGVVLKNGEKVPGTGLILACGHSAHDFLRTCQAQGVAIEAKSFAIGLRIEHLQSEINEWQYGRKDTPEELGAAQYKLQTYWDQEQIGVYTFCMCPGGYVIASATEPKTTVVNGMSNYHRNSPWANAAVVCSIDKETLPGNNPFKMMDFQNNLESKTYALAAAEGSAKSVPAQRVEDFFARRRGHLPIKSSCPSGIVSADLSQILPDGMYTHLRDGLKAFEQKRRGFLKPGAILHAIESRTSSPIRMSRDPETLESINTKGLYPCGEGPGYAGGITSAAVDGMNAALAWIKKYKGTA